MPNGQPRDQWRTGDACAWLPFVHRDGINNVGVHSGRLRKPERQHGAEVARMFAAACQPKLFHHGLVDQVRSAGQRRKEPASPAHSRQVPCIVSSRRQSIRNQAGAVIRLRQCRAAAKLLQFRVVMLC